MQVAVLVVRMTLEERRADAVRESAAHLAVGEQRVEQACRRRGRSRSRVTVTAPVARSTSTAQTSTMKPCAADETTRSSASGGSRFGAA